VDLKGDKLRMKKGDLLFAKRNAYLRRVAIAPHDGFFSAHGMVLRPKSSRVWPDFLPFFLRSDVFMNRAVEISVGSLSPTINWGTLRNQEFALPPVEEQKRIAEVLWAADKLVRRNENVLEAALMLRKSRLSDLRQPNGHFEAERGCLGDYVDRIVGGGTPARNKQEYWNGDIPWMTVKDIPDSGHIGETQEHISNEGLEDSATHLIEQGSVILATRISVGKVVMNDVDLAINQDLKAIYPSRDLDGQFLFYWLQSMEEDIRGRSAGTTVKGIRLENLKSIPCVLPPLRLQERLVDELRAMDSSVAASKENLLDAFRLETSLTDFMIGAAHV